MKALRNPITQTRRDAWTEVNLSRVENNFKQLKKVLSPQTNVMAVVKADAYGHGATLVAKTLEASGVNMFGIASVDEGIQLRSADIHAPILVLGPTPSWAIRSAVENNLEITIFTENHLKDCIHFAARLERNINVHIKVDTGMNRIGISYKEASSFINRVQESPGITVKGVFSHLACAEKPKETDIQVERWNKVLSELDRIPECLHFANSAGVLANHNIHYSMVRVGLQLYGLQPDLPGGVSPIPLQQVLSLKGRINHIHTVTEGEGISYGYSYRVNKAEMKVATIPIGYADGVSRRLSNQIVGCINGQKVNQIGNITMDQMMFDITDVPAVEVGDIILLLGEDEACSISIDEWAASLGTINYEIPCMLRVRLPRIYTSE